MVPHPMPSLGYIQVTTPHSNGNIASVVQLPVCKHHLHSQVDDTTGHMSNVYIRLDTVFYLFTPYTHHEDTHFRGDNRRNNIPTW